MVIAIETSYNWEKHFSELNAKHSAPINSTNQNSNTAYTPLQTLIDKLIEENALGKLFGNTLKGTNLTQTKVSSQSDFQDSENIFSSQLEQDINNRLELLCRKYATKSLSTEDRVRFEIATQRTIMAIPRVQEEDFKNLENITERLNNSFDSIEHLLD